jgi:predicted GNAT family acetyltransferase
MTDLSFTHAAELSRYELRRGDEIVAVLDYRDNGSTIALTRAFTVPAFRGQGLAAEVTARTVADIAARGDRTVSPVCWYVADWFAAHPEHSALLASAGR